MARPRNSGAETVAVASESTAASSTGVRIELLGGFRVTVGDQIITADAWRLRKAAALVKLLALAPKAQLHREELMDLLWPDLDPASAQNNLHHALHVARRVLDPVPGASRSLRIRGDLVVLDPPGRLVVDVDVFLTAPSLARQTRDRADYRAALALYRGDLLPEDPYAEWAADRRTGLHTLALSLLLELAARSTERGDLVSATDALQGAIRLEPSSEEAHATLMRTYARSGQRHQALRQYAQLAQILRDELNAEPDPATQVLYHSILVGELPAGPTPITADEPTRAEASGLHNLPATISSFVGRDAELAEIKRLLGTTRLLTIVGVGGAGKTRLALQVGRELVGVYDDGVFLVSLSSLTEPIEIAEAVARTLSIGEQTGQSVLDALTVTLGQKQLLLILDNCEHLIDACAQLAEALLTACPRLQILATSREALNIPGEVTGVIPPLGLPDPDDLPHIDELLSFDAVRLFVERARSRQPTFALQSETAQDIALICWQLEGIPLGIELAAARIALLSVEQIAARLDDTLGLLTGGSRTSQPRQQTLRGALDWSYELLSGDEQAIFRRLSVFAGGWTLEAAESIGKGLDVLELLSRLVDKSLVVAGAVDDAIRYRYLEPVRQYARQRLVESGEQDAVQRCHAEFFAKLAVEARPELQGPNQAPWIARLEAEQANLHTVLQWCLSPFGDLDLGLKLTTNIWWFWYMRGYLSEARDRLAAILNTTCDRVTADRAETLRGAGVLASAQGEYDQASSLLHEALRLFRALDRPRDIAHALNSLGIIATEQDDLAQAIVYHEEALALRQELADRAGIATSLLNIGFAVHQQGDIERSRQLHEQTLSIARELENLALVALCLHNLGHIALSQEDIPRAAELLEESLAVYRDLGDKRRITSCLEALATVASSQSNPERAATLYGASNALRQEIGATMYARQEANWEESVAGLRDLLGEHRFEAAWRRGVAMSLAEMIAYALECDTAERADRREDARSRQQAGTLTPREMEIAELLAHGLTNRQIASRLVIAERTADTHVANILKKLGLESRAQVAVWITEQRLAPAGLSTTSERRT